MSGHGSCITVRVKRLAGNEIEQGIGIPTIESHASNVPIDKRNCIRGCLNPRHRGSSDEIIEEHVGANMGYVYAVTRMLFGVPDEILDVTRSSRRVRK